MRLSSKAETYDCVYVEALSDARASSGTGRVPVQLERACPIGLCSLSC